MSWKSNIQRWRNHRETNLINGTTKTKLFAINWLIESRSHWCSKIYAYLMAIFCFGNDRIKFPFRISIPDSNSVSIWFIRSNKHRNSKEDTQFQTLRIEMRIVTRVDANSSVPEMLFSLIQSQFVASNGRLFVFSIAIFDEEHLDVFRIQGNLRQNKFNNFYGFIGLTVKQWQKWRKSFSLFK